MATKDKRVVITGEQRTDIDPSPLALVIIRLARQWLQTQPTTSPEVSPSDGKDQSAV
jgi:hypothetical protein